MTAVIAATASLRYRRDMRPTNRVRVAALLKRPDAGYVAGLEDAHHAVKAQSIEAARHLAIFISRVRDLDLDELQELYDETFRRRGAPGAHLARALASPADSGDVLDALVSALPNLDADRNPFAYAVRSLCCVLLAGVGSGDRA